jgi:beta-lactamase class D
MILAACGGPSDGGPSTGGKPSFTLSEDPALVACVAEHGFAGTVVIVDLATGSGWTGPMDPVDRALLPASTFKVASTLMALDARLVQDRHTELPWDGIRRSREETNQPLDLGSAFRVSAVPHYQALVRELGQERVAAYLEALDYGNRDASGGLDTFWLTGGLRISPREQVQFLARLVEGTLPLPEPVMAEVREIMVMERSEHHVLRAKTGLATPPVDGADGAEGEVIGWWVGWLERFPTADAVAENAGPGPYLFATALTAPAPTPPGFADARLEVTRCALATRLAGSPAPP